jgi:AhpD family alkylhydroperoxidase
MPRIDVTDDLTSWMLLRPDLAVGLGAFSDAVYNKSQLPLREREIARIRIAEINGCELCRNTRDAWGADHGVDEDLYEHARDWRSWPGFSNRERLAAEFAERIAEDHVGLRDDDGFWRRLRAAFGDDEIVDLGICCALWLGSGRVMRTLDVAQSCSLTLHDEAPTHV